MNKEFIDKGVNWILNSGIQNVGTSEDLDGGFNSWFDLDKKTYKYVYSEITGYGMTKLIYLYNRFGYKILLERAELAADWILKNALHNSGGILTRNYLEVDDNASGYSFDSGFVYTFDTGMVLYGLTSVYNATKNNKYLEAAKKIADFLVLRAQKNDGSFYAYYDSKNNKFISEYKKWSTQSGSFHAKIAIGLVDLYLITGNELYKQGAIKICDFAFLLQQSNGRFVSFLDNGGTYMHPHIYTCEGLTFVGVKLGESRFVTSACKGIYWTIDNMQKNGGVPCSFVNNNFNFNERVDTSSQALRLLSYFLSKGLMQEYLYKANQLSEHLLKWQKKDNEHAGGFYYGFNDDGKKLNHINSWVSMFALQSLFYSLDFNNGNNISIDTIV